MEYYGNYGNYGGNYNVAYYNAFMDQYGGIVWTVFWVTMILTFVFLILYTIGTWKVFTKAGEEGWKCLIPFYYNYIRFKISDAETLFWVWLVLWIATCIFSRPNNLGAMAAGLTFNLAAWIVQSIADYRLAKAFGYGIGFTIGLVFLEPIFILILGCGSAEYEYGGSGSNWY